MSAFDDWAAGEGRDVVDFRTVRGLTLDADGLAADTLRSRLWQTFEAGRRSDPYATAVRDALSRAQSQIDALRERVDLIQAPQSFAAGPWIPGEPPEECMASGESVLIWDCDGEVPPQFGEGRAALIVHWSPAMKLWTNGRDALNASSIDFHARINPPKQEGGEG